MEKPLADWLLDYFSPRLKKYSLYLIPVPFGIRLVIWKIWPLDGSGLTGALDIKEINDERSIHFALSLIKRPACAIPSDIGKPARDSSLLRHHRFNGPRWWFDRAWKFVKTLKNVDKFEILPYHTMGNSNGVNWNSVQIGGCETTDKEQVKMQRFDGNKVTKITKTGQG